MSVLATISIWVTSMFFGSHSSLETGLFAPKSGGTARHTSCLKPGWPSNSAIWLAGGKFPSLGYDAFRSYGKNTGLYLVFFDDSFTCSFMLRNTDFSFERAVLGQFDQQEPDCTENFSFRLSQLCMRHLAEWQVDVFWEWGLFVLAHAPFRSYWSKWKKRRAKFCFSFKTLTSGTLSWSY